MNYPITIPKVIYVLCSFEFINYSIKRDKSKHDLMIKKTNFTHKVQHNPNIIYYYSDAIPQFNTLYSSFKAGFLSPFWPIAVIIYKYNDKK